MEPEKAVIGDGVFPAAKRRNQTGGGFGLCRFMRRRSQRFSFCMIASPNSIISIRKGTVERRPLCAAFPIRRHEALWLVQTRSGRVPQFVSDRQPRGSSFLAAFQGSATIADFLGEIWGEDSLDRRLDWIGDARPCRHDVGEVGGDRGRFIASEFIRRNCQLA